MKCWFDLSKLLFCFLQADEKNPCVLSLDECQLKALLDEAIAYKNPIDREGKSDLFKVNIPKCNMYFQSNSSQTQRS